MSTRTPSLHERDGCSFEIAVLPFVSLKLPARLNPGLLLQLRSPPHDSIARQVAHMMQFTCERSFVVLRVEQRAVSPQPAARGAVIAIFPLHAIRIGRESGIGTTRQLGAIQASSAVHARAAAAGARRTRRPVLNSDLGC